MHKIRKITLQACLALVVLGVVLTYGAAAGVHSRTPLPTQSPEPLERDVHDGITRGHQYTLIANILR
jgi:hypothetical protein